VARRAQQFYDVISGITVTADRQAALISSFTACMAAAVDVAVEDVPAIDSVRGDWLGMLRQWLAGRHMGLVRIADPQSFKWPGYWIAIAGNDSDAELAVLMFGSPSGVVLSPSDPTLVGRASSTLSIKEGYVVSAFDPVRPMVGARPSLEGTVEGLFVAGSAGASMREVEQAVAIAGRGLEGDRYAAGAGTFTPADPALKGYDLTLIESEVIDGMRPSAEGRLARGEARRNIVTSGIDLNALVGRTFAVGEVMCFGQRLCEPCSHLERLTKPGVLKQLVHRGGLRADIITDGVVKRGDPIRPVARD